MKIKKFNEILNNLDEPEVGDYVILTDNELIGSSTSQKKLYIDFIENHVGQIISINNQFDWFTVEYNNIPFQLQVFFNKNKATFTKKNIVCIGKTIDEVKLKYAAKKYNLY